MASEASKRASHYLEQAKACSETPDEGHTLEFAEDAMFYWEQANEAFEELSEIVEIIKESDKLPQKQTFKKASDTSSPEPEEKDAPTVPVEVLPSIWDWD